MGLSRDASLRNFNPGQMSSIYIYTLARAEDLSIDRILLWCVLLVAVQLLCPDLALIRTHGSGGSMSCHDSSSCRDRHRVFQMSISRTQNVQNALEELTHHRDFG